MDNSGKNPVFRLRSYRTKSPFFKGVWGDQNLPHSSENCLESIPELHQRKNQKMNTSRKIQIAIGTMLLWVSTAASGLAATSINSGKFQSDTVKVSGDSLPVRSLKPDTHLIAQNYGDMLSGMALRRDDNGYIPKWEEALKQPNAQQIIVAFCPSQPQDKVEDCWRVLDLWLKAQIFKALESENYDLFNTFSPIRNAVMDVREN